MQRSSISLSINPVGWVSAAIAIGVAGCAPIYTSFDPDAPDAPDHLNQRHVAVVEQQQNERLAEARVARDSGDDERAFSLLNETSIVDPGSVVAQLQTGRLRMDRQEYADAEAAFTRAAALAPWNFDAQYGRGQARQMLGRYESAVWAYHRALVIRPESADANRELATTYLQMGRPQDAIAFAEKAVLHAPASGPARANLGAAYDRVGRYREATEQYVVAMEYMDPTPPLLTNLVGTLIQEGRFEEARDRAEYLVRIAPSASAYERLGRSRFRLGEYEPSITAYRRSIELDPLYWPALNGIGSNALLRWQAGGREDPELARISREAYRQSLRINPQQPEVLDVLLSSGL